MSTFTAHARHDPAADTVRVTTYRRITPHDGPRHRSRTGQFLVRRVDLRKLADTLHDLADDLDRAHREATQVGASESRHPDPQTKAPAVNSLPPVGDPHRAGAHTYHTDF